jgi:ribulose kinase
MPYTLGIDYGSNSVRAIVVDVANGRELQPGQSGLLALDWNNGNRTILVDPRLSGLILGQTLHTTRAPSSSRICEYGVPIDRVVCAGGIAEKNAMLMQIYADITGCTMQVAGSSEACALGSAVSAAVLAGAHPYRGRFKEWAGNSNTNHHAIIDFKGRSYFIYHNGGLFTGGSYRRSVCAENLNYNADGTIQRIFKTSEGGLKANDCQVRRN